MPVPFQQPGWITETGKPYPGAENTAALIQIHQDSQRVYELAKTEKLKVQARRKGQEEADKEDLQLRQARTRKASDFQPKRTHWLWDGRIPLGEVTMIIGKGGIGKSQILSMFAAWLSIGDMQGEFHGQPKNVLYVVNEDSIERTVVPRLIAAGADLPAQPNLERIHFLHIENQGELHRLDLTRDCERIADAARRLDAAAVFFDPLSSNLSVKSNNGDEVRPVMEKLRLMAEECRLAVVGLGHVKKSQSRDLLEALLGSSELGNVVRAAMGVMRDPDDEEGGIVLSQEKNNLGPDVCGYKYKIVDGSCTGRDGLPIPTSRLKWMGKTDQKVGDMIADTASAMVTKGALTEATDFIRQYLIGEGGQAPRGEVIRQGQADGHSRPTIDRAARVLKLASVSSGRGAAKLWQLPVQAPEGPDFLKTLGG